jgi:hypothetical protein
MPVPADEHRRHSTVRARVHLVEKYHREEPRAFIASRRRVDADVANEGVNNL